MNKVALLGVGFMGAPYARHLLEAGLEVRLYNRTRSKAEAIEGALVFDTPSEAARGAELLFTVLADDDSVLQMVDEELLGEMAPEGVHLSCSTISVEATMALAGRAGRANRQHLSLPFLGRPDFVARKQHQFLLSGSSSKRNEIVKLLEATCKAVIDFGEDPTAAVRGKLATNFVIASAIISMGEAFAMLEAAGIDPGKGYELWTSSLFDCPLYKNYGSKILEQDFQEPFFRLRLGLKDTTLIESEARSNGIHGGLIEAVRESFARSVQAGDGELDWTAVTRLIRKK